MPTPRDIVKKITKEAKRQGKTFVFDGEGTNHTHYRLEGTLIPIARHRELDNQYAEMLYRECAEHLGKGWWRS